MKKQFILLLLAFVSFLNAQEVNNNNDLKITLKEVFYNPNKFGGAKDEYGEDLKNPEILYDIFFNVEIDGFDIDNPIDFNNFSLVENDLKLRQRPFHAGFDNFSSWAVTKINLKDFKSEDNFIKYSQEGITNYDHFYVVDYPLKKSESFQQRFCLLSIPPKKNKDKEFDLVFPVKSKNKGDFSLFYKDTLIKKFYLTRDKSLKYKK